MTYDEIGLRALYHQFSVYPMNSAVWSAVKDCPEADQANAALMYGYIDPERGLRLMALAGARLDENQISFGLPNNALDASVGIEEVELDEFHSFDDKDGRLQKVFREKLLKLDQYAADEDLEKTRHMGILDDLRDPVFPDIVTVRLVREGLKPENHPVRLLKDMENCLLGVLEEEPKQDFGFHKGEQITFELRQVGEKKIVAVANVTPVKKLTAEALADGAMLKKAISDFTRKPAENKLLEVCELLRDSFVWIPCNARLSDADMAALESFVETAKKDGVESLVGKRLTNQDEIRLVPDILKRDDTYYFPVFSSEEEMGEYGSHFTKVQKPFLEAVQLAKKSEKELFGMVVNAFSEPFIVPMQLVSAVEKMESRL